MRRRRTREPITKEKSNQGARLSDLYGSLEGVQPGQSGEYVDPGQPDYWALFWLAGVSCSSCSHPTSTDMPDPRLTIQEQLLLLKQQMGTPAAATVGSGPLAHPSDSSALPGAAPVVQTVRHAPVGITPTPAASTEPAKPRGLTPQPPQRGQPASGGDGVGVCVQAPTPVARPEPSGVPASKVPDAVSPPDLEVLIELEGALNKREKDLEDKADALEWDRLGHQIACDQLARERQQWEQELETRKNALAVPRQEQVALSAKLRKRADALASRKALVDSNARANRARSKELEAQAKQQAATERRLVARETRIAGREGKADAADARHRARLQKLTDAMARIAGLLHELDTANDERHQLKRELEKARALAVSALQIPNWDVARWMLSEVEVDIDQFAEKVAFTGDGPFKRSALEVSARDLGLQIGQCGARQPARVLIVGREGWHRPSIEAHLGALEGEEVFVFPQELWVAALLIRYNPLHYLEDEASRSALEAFGAGHPVIEWLRGKQFPWPECRASEELPPTDVEQQVSVSPLVKLEYRVGNKKGVPVARRRRILSNAFDTEQLPMADFVQGVRPAKQREYMESWGGPSTRTRLRRIAWHLAMLISRHARLRNHEVAVAEWEADLAWLKKSYYSPFMRFYWP